jgi:hypothetical protein
MAAAWFQNHPTTSILSYTAAVATLTWAVSNFIIDEKRVNLYKAQKENAETVTKTYEAKVSAVETENSRLRLDVERYLNWLIADPKSLPALAKRISDLEKEKADLQRDLKLASGSSMTKPTSLETKPEPYGFSKSLRLGESFIDPRTQATVGLAAVNSDYTANVYVFSPEGKPQEQAGVKPGTTWLVDSRGKKYKLTIEKINWLTNSAQVSIAEFGK